MFTIACLPVVGLVLRLGLGLDLVSGWIVNVHTYFYCFRLSPTYIVSGGALNSTHSLAVTMPFSVTRQTFVKL